MVTTPSYSSTLWYNLNYSYLDLHTMDIHLKLETTPTTQKLVFIFLIAPDNTSATSKDAEVALRLPCWSS